MTRSLRGLAGAILALLTAVACARHTAPVSAHALYGRGTRHERGVQCPLFGRARSSAELDRLSWAGEEVFITPGGIVPLNLYAVARAKILFVNETSRPERVAFVTGAWRSPVIAPRGHASFTPVNEQSIVFFVEGAPDQKGHIQVGPCFEPGETPRP